MKKITLVLAILCSLYTFGQVGTVFTSGGIKYKITAATTVEVGENSGITGAVVLPATVNYNSVTYQVKGLGNKAFYDCSSLISVNIPNSVTNIGNSVFYRCTSLTSVTIPNSINSIGDEAFYSCAALTTITIPNSVASIGGGAFYSCTSLKSVTIPNSVTRIGVSLFSKCSNLTTVTIPNSVTSIGGDAFNFCSSLTSVTIPSSVKTIDDFAFVGCSGLTTLNIPNSVTSIGRGVFSGCSGLITVIIPQSVTSIGEYAFNLCSGLTSVTVHWTTPLTINADVFYQLNLSTIVLNVPSGTEMAYKTAAVWKDFGTITLNANNFSVNKKLNFYPNPAQFQITFAKQIYTLEIFDIAGKKVKSFQNPTASFDVSPLEKGIYILKGTTIEGNSFNDKLVKE